MNTTRNPSGKGKRGCVAGRRPPRNAFAQWRELRELLVEVGAACAVRAPALRIQRRGGQNNPEQNHPAQQATARRET